MAPQHEQSELLIESMSVNRLLLDEENPRLSEIAAKRSQDALVQVLWDEMAVSEVALSIAANGYFKEEPLFVVPKLLKESTQSSSST